MVDDAGCLIDGAAANPSLSSYPILPEISETTTRFVVYSRHSTSVQIASVDCELPTRGDSRRVTRERFPAPSEGCAFVSLGREAAPRRREDVGARLAGIARPRRGHVRVITTVPVPPVAGERPGPPSG